jgi:16S rRNA (uracil1498-N3)-methyltransferase
MSLTPRFYCPAPLSSGASLLLPPGAARHVQVLRLQPGAPIVLFGGSPPPADGTQGTAPEQAACGEFEATVVEMGRSDVRVLVGRHCAVEREPARRLHLAIGMPANERMDWLVEKATELGVASVQALMTERTVVRLDGERARKKADHWLSIAIASCEQCGRNRVPVLPLALPMRQWLAQMGRPGAPDGGSRLVLSFRAGARPLAEWLREPRGGEAAAVTILSGPEGGLGPAEEQQALDLGFQPVTLGPRVLRSETAAIAALTLLG